MRLYMHLPNQIITACVLLPSFSKNGFKLDKCQYISVDNNINNINQTINLPCKLQLDFVNRNMSTVFSICKKQEIGFITTLNEGLEQLDVKCTKV